MIVLFVLGLFGTKAAVILYFIYRIARWITGKGDAIKKGFEDRIAAQQEEIDELREKNNELQAKNKKTYRRWPSPAFSQSQGRA